MISILYDIFKSWSAKGSVYIYSDPHFNDSEMKYIRKDYIGDEDQIKRINLVFYLFDKDGEPASECSNKISAVIEKEFFAGEGDSFCMSLDTFITFVPEDFLIIDYLYLAKIEYEDGTVWEDPYGLIAFK